MILLYFFFLLPVLTAVVHTFVTPRPWKLGALVELWLGHLIFWGVGIGGVAAFVVLSVPSAADWVAEDWLGWAKGNPFQDVLAWAYLAIGITGLMCLWVKGGFRVAVVLIALFFGIGEFLAILISDAPTQVLVYSIIYDLVGSGILVALLAALYIFAGPMKFWDCHGCKVASKGKK